MKTNNPESGFNSDHTIRQYAHGLLLESQFLPSSTDCWAVWAKNKAKKAIPVAVAPKPEVEIWRRPKKWTFWPWFPIHSFRHFFARTHRFATIQSVTDRQTTDRRQTTHRAKGSTDSTVGQKLLATSAKLKTLCQINAIKNTNRFLISKKEVLY